MPRTQRKSQWLEFKKNRYEPQVIGEYLSALSNSSCLAGKPRAYLLFGVEDDTHAVVGTDFDPYATKGKGNQDLPLWTSLGFYPKIGFEPRVVDHPQGRVVLFDINPAWVLAVEFYGKAYIRVGSSKHGASTIPNKEHANRKMSN